ncbi:MAG: FG-GAP-like repeat-containing protein, partial [Planctomycetota bacterium]
MNVTRKWKRNAWMAAIVCGAMILFSGCNTRTNVGNESETASGLTETEQDNAIVTIKEASQIGDWQKAWLAAESLLRQRSLDSVRGLPLNQDAVDLGSGKPLTVPSWMMIARVAHETNRLPEAASFLCRACEAEQYASPARIQQTLVAMIEAGRLTDGMVFLQRAIDARPELIDAKRLLFDLYMGSDNRVRAMPLGRELIQKRKFDVDLLIAMGNTERRRDDPEPLNEMLKRNPGDKRPLLGIARVRFDEKKYGEALQLLREVADAHSEYHPAQVVLGQTIVASGKLDELQRWAESQSNGVEVYPGYWIALGDWSRATDQPLPAIRCFLEATRSEDPDRVQVWTRLATLLPQVAEGRSIDTKVIKAVQTRASDLTRLASLQDRFTRTGSLSREIALDIAKTLQKLGRLWEAEAWSAMATTLPEDEAVDVAGFRSSLVGRLSSETPWQIKSERAEFELDPRDFPLPSIEQIISSERHQEEGRSLDAFHALQEGLVQTRWKMDDEAGERGLRFFGRTGDQLDRPGIMLFQTLGCGGGTIDFDRDGWQDLYFTAAGGMPPERDSEPNGLFRNLNGQFRPVESLARVNDRGFGQGVAIGDLNSDGFQDLLVLNYGPNRLLLNQGDGSFKDISHRLPAEPYDEWSSSGAMADLNGDGLTDLFIVNYCSGLGPVIQTCHARGACSPMVFAACEDRVVMNGGDRRLEDQSKKWLGEQTDAGRGLGILVGQLDGKPGNDCYVANDMTRNHLYVPSEDRDRLDEVAMLRGLGGDDRGISQGSMGIASGDLDGDGDMDLVVTNFDGEYNTFYEQTSPGLWQD